MIGECLDAVFILAVLGILIGGLTLHLEDK